MRIVGAVSIRLVDGVGINLRAAGRLGEPTEEFGVLARRLGGENERFTVGLLCFLCCAVTEIPRQRIAVGGKLRIEGFAVVIVTELYRLPPETDVYQPLNA